jgi:hypothetical protein
MTRPTGRRIAANPIPYWSRGGRTDKSPAVFEEAFADFAKIGYAAVKADVPDGMLDSRFESHKIAYEWAQRNLSISS